MVQHIEPLKRGTVLIIGCIWPEPSSTAAGNRMLQLIEFFLEQGFKTIFASTALETHFSMPLNRLKVDKVAIKMNDPSFDTFITKLKPEIVLFDRFLTEEQFGWRVAECTPDALRVLDTEDLHSLRNAREIEFKNNRKFSIDAWLQNEMTKREIASIYRCDLSLIISSYEMVLLTSLLKLDEDLLFHLPFMLPEISENEINSWLPYKDRHDFIYIGNGKHAPNVDAIIWLKQEIWPKIRKMLPDTNLFIYGNYLPKHIEEMHKPEEGFWIKGWVDDAKTVMGRSKINLVPLRFGAGIKGKLVLAMQMGTPSITTSIGAEGMHESLPWSGEIVENSEEFAQAAVGLYNDSVVWYRAQRNAIKIINDLYQKEIHRNRLKFKIIELQQNIKKHRIKNFTGAMLQHQTLRSTKYFSKWIEEKNARNSP